MATPPTNRPLPEGVRVVHMTPAEVIQHADNIVSIQTSSGVVRLYFPSSSPEIISLEAVLQELHNLKEENVTLQRKVGLFQQVFRNKEKLISILKHLGITVKQQRREG